MNREILFRGKRIDNGAWVEGYVVVYPSGKTEVHKKCTQPPDILLVCETDPETVCQYTGLTDRNGKKIFEGDIVSAWSEGSHAIGRVKQRIDGLWLLYPAWQNKIMWGLCPNNKGETTVEIVGNIFDNPALLEGGSE